MRVYFDNGKLKIKLPDEQTEQSRKFLYDTYYIFKKFTAEKGVMEVQVESQWKQLIAAAKRHEIDIAEDVEDYYQWRIRVDQEEAQRKSIEEDRKKAIESANTKQQSGCGMCIHLEYAPAHWEEVNGKKVWVSGKHYCKHAMEVCRYRASDVEYEFEYYKANRFYNPPQGYNPPAFVAQPFPCAGCEYLEKANKAWEEINKEKEGNV